MTVTSDAAVLKVLGDRPTSTHQIQHLLADEAGIEFDEVPIYRLRRMLARLEAKGAVVASGGPKRDDLPGWPSGDGRNVYWATTKVAEKIAKTHEERLTFEREIEEERERLLRDLHRALRPFEREALGLTNLPTRLRAAKENNVSLDELGYLSSGTHPRGPLTWAMDQLRVVVGVIVECRGG